MKTASRDDKSRSGGPRGFLLGCLIGLYFCFAGVSEAGVILTRWTDLPVSQLTPSQLYERAQRNPGDRDVMFVVAARAYMEGQTEEAFRVFDRLHNMDASFPPSRVAGALVAIDAGELKRARTELDHLEKDSYDPVWVELARADLALMQSDLKKMAAHVEAATKLDPQSAEPWGYRARWALRQQDFDKALAALETASKLAPERLQFYDAAANIWFDLGFPDKCRSALEEAARRDADRPPAALSMAELFAKIGDRPGARRMCEELLQHDAKQPEVLLILAQVELATENSERGKELLEQVLELQPSNVGAMVLLADSLSGRAQFKEAREYYELAFKVTPAEPIIANNLAAMLLEVDAEMPRALELARQAHLSLPQHPKALATLGWAEWRNGDTTAGERYLRRSVRLDPADPSARLILGKFLLATNQPEGARRELEAARQLKPTGYVAEQIERLFGSLPEEK